MGSRPQSLIPRPQTLSSRRVLHNPNFVVGQTVQLVDKLIDLPVGGVDLPLNGRGGKAELTLPTVEEDGSLEEDPAKEDKCARGGKKTQPKKTTFSNRPNCGSGYIPHPDCHPSAGKAQA